MAGISLTPTYPQFHEVSGGQPLNGGYIYLGTVGLNPETNPVTAYWDSALTTPAAQPIRTISGFPSRNGTPSKLFVSANCSITVKDSSLNLVYTSDSALQEIGAINLPDTVPISVDSISAMLALESLANGQQVIVSNYHSDTEGGGGIFYLDSSGDKANHDGGTVIDPDVSFPTDWTNQSQLTTWFTAGSGTGVWRRIDIDGDAYRAKDYGLKGDGSTNDTIIIDNLNVAGNVVDLGGGSSVYIGDFTQSATFINGDIVSSTFGTYSYVDNIIRGSENFTVGTSGTFKRLDAALDYLKSQVILGDVTLTILEKFSTEAASDPLALDGYMFDHPQSLKVSIVGSALTGSVPQNSDMVGTESTDKAYVLSQYASAIYLHGAGISGTYGLACPNGLGSIKRLAVVSATRYSLDIGFNGSHFSSNNAPTCIFQEVSVFGGVWGIIAKNANIIFNTDTFFAYQFSGGPIDMIGGTLRADVGNLECYTQGGVRSATGPQYAIYAEEGADLYLPFSSTKRFRAKGSFLHGLFVTEGVRAKGDYMEFDGVTQPVTANKNSMVTGEDWVITNADPANTAAVPGATQGGYANNNYQGALLCAGVGSTVSLIGGSISACEARYCGVAAGGSLINGYDSLGIDDCKFTVAAFNYDLSYKSLLYATLTNPRAASLDQAVAICQSGVRTSATGITYSPVVNTPTNGNLFSTVS